MTGTFVPQKNPLIEFSGYGKIEGDGAIVHEDKEEDEFSKVLEEVRQLHASKGNDYGTETDSYSNIRAATDFGVDPTLAIALRMNDKMKRIKAFFKNGELVNDTVEDDYLDIATYAIIAVVLRREAEAPKLAINGVKREVEGTLTKWQGNKPALGTKQNPYCGANPRKRGAYKAGDWYRFRNGSLGMATSKRHDRVVTDWFFPDE